MRTFGISIITVALLAGSAVGVVAQTEEATTPDPMAPSYFTGTVTQNGAELAEGTWSEVEGGFEGRGFSYGPRVLESTDPRFSGELYSTWNTNAFELADQTFGVQSAVFEIIAEDGAWVGPTTDIFVVDLIDMDTAILAGQGIYEGLTANVHFTWSADPPTVRGVIIPGEMPPQPEPVMTQ